MSEPDRGLFGLPECTRPTRDAERGVWTSTHIPSGREIEATSLERLEIRATVARISHSLKSAWGRGV
ncbi:hypothetical protein Aple_034240 [Acrocarpospora pleiomorpha]|uniref:Uncharacterized protein n=1 Tax=Acrocarpospora pleiomorpha TaxID=90975 RepID=A0A5M3XQG6_9ACTN|nr:hypothetical protein Aple_034240 [Acrocarpospora pleiomorpha]